MLTLSAPGKLMLSGEWSILEKNVRCIVLAVEQRIFATIHPSKEIKVHLKDFNIKSSARISEDSLILENRDDKLKFTQYAIDTAVKYLQTLNIPIKTFYLETWGEISTVKNQDTGEEMKVGFGSSAAAVVSIISVILQFHGVSYLNRQDKEKIFKLGIIAHYLGQGKIGSGFDVAASTFGGALIYRRFDPEWLQQNLEAYPIAKVIDQEWPLLQNIPLKIPPELILIVGFTGTSASTRKLVKQMKLFKEKDPESYFTLISRIADVTESLILAIKSNQKASILQTLDQNRLLLEELSYACSCHLEIEAHQIMSHIASKYEAVAKFSGAGGGDCSVGATFNESNARRILQEWKENGLMPIDIRLSPNGVRVENQ
jgi:phosphomevalonate kinase